MVPFQSPLIILDSKSDMCMSKNGKDNQTTRHIYRIIQFVINGEEINLHKKVWCEGGMKLEDIGTNNVMEDEFIPRL